MNIKKVKTEKKKCEKALDFWKKRKEKKKEHGLNIKFIIH